MSAPIALSRERVLHIRPIWQPDPAQPDIFTLVIQFTNGATKSWQVQAPKLPITESWIRMALTMLVERIVADLRFGHSLPECKPDKRAFQEFDRHSDALMADFHSMLSSWAKWRIEHYRKGALPAWKFQEDPGNDPEWQPPMVNPGEEPPGGW